MPVPLKSDRSVWDMDYPEKHASDIEEEVYTYHLPPPTTEGYVPVVSSGHWVLTPASSGTSSGVTPGSGIYLDDLLDVSATTPSGGNVIAFDGIDTWQATDILTNIHYIEFDTSNAGEATEGRLGWDATEIVPTVGIAGDYSLPLLKSLFKRVKNDSGEILNVGDVVYVSGSVGASFAKVKKANANNILTSYVLGMVFQKPIEDGHFGIVVETGYIRNINTDGMSYGEPVWLDTTDGGFTHTKPTAPNISVLLGYVIRAHATEGSLAIRPTVIPRISALSDVYIPSLTDGDTLVWNSASETWVASGVPSGGGGDPLFNILGVLVTETTVGGKYIVTKPMTISAVYIHCTDPGTAGSTIVDINVNGDSIFTTQSNRPELSFEDSVAKSGTPDVVSLVENDIISLDIDQVATDAVGLTAVVATSSSGGSTPPTPEEVSRQTILTFSGDLETGENPLKVYNLIGDQVISKIFLSVATAPTGSGIKVDLHKNGVTIFTNQDNRPVITDGQTTGYTVTIDVPTWELDSYLTASIDEIGTTTAGANLVVHILHS